LRKLLPLFLIWATALPAQDLYDYAHSRAFARYLLQSQQYNLAAEEYERLIFVQPANDTLRAELLRAYRRGKMPARGLQHWARWQADSLPTARFLRVEYTKLLLTGGHAAEARTLAALPEWLDSTQARRTRLYADILEQKWPDARQILAAVPPGEKIPRRADLEKLVARGERAKKKNPWVATALSVPLPGLGKAYAGQWKDGLVSLIFVGLNTWQAYRRFDREGLDTFWGWVHGGFALGFYTGNLYGSHKAARRHNQLKNKRLRQESEALLFPILD
jgi:hypothetical protein